MYEFLWIYKRFYSLESIKEFILSYVDLNYDSLPQTTCIMIWVRKSHGMWQDTSSFMELSDSCLFCKIR